MPNPNSDTRASTSVAAITAATEAQAQPAPKQIIPEPVPARSAYPLTEGCLLLGGISPATAYRWHDKGLIKLVKIGGRTLVPASEITRLTSTAA